MLCSVCLHYLQLLFYLAAQANRVTVSHLKKKKRSVPRYLPVNGSGQVGLEQTNLHCCGNCSLYFISFDVSSHV